MTFAVKLVVGALAGILLAGTGLWLGRASGDPDTTTTTIAPTTLPPIAVEPAWISDGGVRFASTVVVRTGIRSDDGVLAFDYELASLAGNSPFGATNPPALPERWAMTSSAGDRYAAETDPPRIDDFSETDDPVEDSVRFDVPTGFEASDADSIAVVGWRIAVPMSTVVELPPEPGASVTLADGTVITVETILEQTTGTIIGFDVDAPPDPWRITADTPFGASSTYTGSGPGWLRAATTIGGTGLTGGATGFQLLWHGPTAPPAIAVEVNTTRWMPRDMPTTVYRRNSNG